MKGSSLYNYVSLGQATKPTDKQPLEKKRMVHNHLESPRDTMSHSARDIEKNHHGSGSVYLICLQERIYLGKDFTERCSQVPGTQGRHLYPGGKLCLFTAPQAICLHTVFHLLEAAPSSAQARGQFSCPPTSET